MQHQKQLNQWWKLDNRASPAILKCLAAAFLSYTENSIADALQAAASNIMIKGRTATQGQSIDLS